MIALSRCRVITVVALLLLVTAFSGCSLRKPSIFIPTSPPFLAMPKTHPQVALVLGAGGARGYAHLGVLRVLRSAGVPIDMVAGASVGSVVGALYADEGSYKQAYQAMMSANFWDFADISVIPRLSGIMTGYHLESFLLDKLHAKQFSQLKIPLVIMTTDLRTGKEFIIRSGPVAPAATASSSIPGLVQPPTLYGHTLVDGGVIDPVPVDITAPYHPKLVIAVNIDKQTSANIPYTQFGILSKSFSIMSKRLSVLMAKRADVVIRPKLGQASAFDVSDKQLLFIQGEKAARQALPKILRIMKARNIAPRYK